MAKEDQIDHREMERKKVLVTRENLILLKKIIQNQLVSQITLNTLEKKHLKIHQIVETIKAQALVERKNLKAEVIDLKTLLLKNIVIKELKLRIF